MTAYVWMAELIQAEACQELITAIAEKRNIA